MGICPQIRRTERRPGWLGWDEQGTVLGDEVRGVMGPDHAGPCEPCEAFPRREMGADTEKAL